MKPITVFLLFAVSGVMSGCVGYVEPRGEHDMYRDGRGDNRERMDRDRDRNREGERRRDDDRDRR